MQRHHCQYCSHMYLMEKLDCGLCSVPLGDPTQQANPHSSKYRSPDCQQLHPSCNQALRYPFWTPNRGPLLSSDWLVNSVMEVSHDDWQAVTGSRNRSPVAMSTALAAFSTQTKCCKDRIHHCLLRLYHGEEDEMSSRSKTWAKHHWYIQIQIFLSLLAWQMSV